jgi:hypothetical protein
MSMVMTMFNETFYIQDLIKPKNNFLRNVPTGSNLNYYQHKNGKDVGTFLSIQLRAINFQKVLLQEDTRTLLNNLYPKYIKTS